MLKIRLARTGKKAQPFFRIVVAEHSRPVQGKFIEVVGHHNPIAKDTVIKEDRIKYWISNGATPSDSAAAIFKLKGMPDMDKYLEPRNKKRRKKGEPEEEEAPAAAPAESGGDAAPAEEKAAEEALKEEVKEEAPKEEAPKEETKEESAPAPAEEAKEEEPKKDAAEESPENKD